MEEKKINKRIVFSVVAVLLLIAVVAGATYAYFSATKSSGVQTVTTATMDLAFDDTTPAVTAPSLTPIRQAEIETKAAKKSFKATNNGTGPMYLQMKLTDVDMDPELKDLWFRWALYEEGTRIGIGTFYEAETEVFMQQNMELEPGEANAKDYDLYIWIEDSDEEQNDLQGKTFSGKVTVNGSIAEYEDVLLMESENTDDGSITPYYYSTDITEVTSIGVDVEYDELYFTNNLSMFFTNLSSLKFVEGIAEPRILPISLTEISAKTELHPWSGSFKYLTNLISFESIVFYDETFKLPSSLTNVDIEVIPEWGATETTIDFSNLVNLESLDISKCSDTTTTFTIILPESIKDTVTINNSLTNSTIVYQ